MGKLIKAGVILVLLVAIIGGGYGAYYYLVALPKAVDARDLAKVSLPGLPTPDPSTPDFEKAKALKLALKVPEAREGLEDFLARFPESTHRDEAEAMLGDLNLAALFSGQPGPDKVDYIVEKGDVLDRVARKMHSSPELIFQANSLERVNLQIGQRLEIPQVDFALQVHVASKKLLLLNGGRFFKAYPIQDAHPLARKSPMIKTKVQEKVAFASARRVVFGSKEFANSVRSLTLAGQPAFTVYGESLDAAFRPAGSGIGLSASDVGEVHTLVNVGTPVTISAD